MIAATWFVGDVTSCVSGLLGATLLQPYVNARLRRPLQSQNIVTHPPSWLDLGAQSLDSQATSDKGCEPGLRVQNSKWGSSFPAFRTHGVRGPYHKRKN
ncbi:hypothetical protein B0I37DRAFT_141769 [Chaetomium sp. MPI-CAGE-AT-0009]|nr:hypothetical protein B0I37DRAFT_141769 [Chaetomium sp. MPI-CAGE-AT-0009]